MKLVFAESVRLLVASFLLLMSLVTVAEPIHIPDPKLRKSLNSAFGMPEDAPLTEAQLGGLTILWAGSEGITDLTGIEHAVNLEELELSGNWISDLSPLSGLSSLEKLYLSKNEITDLSPLAGMTGLQHLYLEENTISDLEPLADLVGLQVLSLQNNEIVDLLPLAGLSNLRFLILEHNLIEDIAALEGLTGLTDLHLDYNYLDVLDGSDDRLIIQSLWDAGVRVRWTSQYFAEISVDTDLILQSGLPGDTVTFSIYLENRGLGPLEFTVSTSADWIIPGSNEGIIARSGATYLPVELASLPEYSGSLTGTVTINSNDPFSPVIEVPFEVHPPISIPDRGLKAALQTYLNLPEDASISAQQMATVVSLSNFRGIRSLEGLEFAINLTTLRLHGNEFTDLSPLTGLTSLWELTLYNNQISDLAAVADLPNLAYLDVHDNYLDIQPGSPDRAIIDALSQRATVYYEPQRTDRITFEDWAGQLNLPTGASGPLDTSGPLRLPNLLAYAMGLNPLTADASQLPSAAVEIPGYSYLLTYYRDTKALGVDLQILTSTDLMHFAPDEPDGIEYLWSDGNGWQQVRVRFLSPESSIFFRLEATAY